MNISTSLNIPEIRNTRPKSDVSKKNPESVQPQNVESKRDEVSFSKFDEFDRLFPNAPASVREAWKAAEKEAGITPLGEDMRESQSRMMMLVKLRVEKKLTSMHNKESAIQLADQLIWEMNNPLIIKNDPKSIKDNETDMKFYTAFRKNLDAIKENT